jgi:hypothetical protein
MKKYLSFGVLLLLLVGIHCQSDIPTVSEWLGLRIINEPYATQIFRTAGKGNAFVNWWAGGYLQPGGYFEIQLHDKNSGELLLTKKYAYGDSLTGYTEKAVFDWWHAEATDSILLKANHTYQIKIWGDNMGDVGCGWGLWLYELGTKPQRHQKPPEQNLNFN